VLQEETLENSESEEAKRMEISPGGDLQNEASNEEKLTPEISGAEKPKEKVSQEGEVQEEKPQEGKVTEKKAELDRYLKPIRVEEVNDCGEVKSAEVLKALEGVERDFDQEIKDNEGDEVDFNKRAEAKKIVEAGGKLVAHNETEHGRQAQDVGEVEVDAEVGLDVGSEADGCIETSKDSGKNDESEESQARHPKTGDEDLHQVGTQPTEQQTEALTLVSVAPGPAMTQVQIEEWLVRGQGGSEERATTFEFDSRGEIDHTKAGIDDVGHFHRLLEQYTRLRLIKPSDRLPALSGLCRRVQDLRGRYCAGLWYDSLAYDLMWRVDTLDPNIEDAGRPVGYRGPSWSWVSVNSPVTYWSDIKDLYYRPFGFQVSAKVTMAGRILLARLYLGRSSSSCIALLPFSKIPTIPHCIPIRMLSIHLYIL
jgi:hypothetical protein